MVETERGETGRMIGCDWEIGNPVVVISLCGGGIGASRRVTCVGAGDVCERNLGGRGMFEGGGGFGVAGPVDAFWGVFGSGSCSIAGDPFI